MTDPEQVSTDLSQSRCPSPRRLSDYSQWWPPSRFLISSQAPSQADKVGDGVTNICGGRGIGIPCPKYQALGEAQMFVIYMVYKSIYLTLYMFPLKGGGGGGFWSENIQWGSMASAWYVHELPWSPCACVCATGYRSMARQITISKTYELITDVKSNVNIQLNHMYQIV